MKRALTAFYLLANLLTISYCSAQTGNAPYTIPVVVHVIHNNGPENIPDSLIIQSLSRINDNFNMRNAGLGGVAPAFAGIVADMQIDFCLSRTDPQGSATTGIERIQNTLTYFGDSPAVKIHQWPHDRYFNIWIVDSLSHYKRGYATSPAQGSINPGLDGAVVPYTLFETGSAGDGILTNVIGHYLNLENIWGNTNDPEVACGDDFIYDTPITKGTTISCDTTWSICDPPYRENIQNFMDWGPCVCMFTNGQKQRVYAALDTSIGGRNNLWTVTNLAVTCSAPTGIGTIYTNEVSIIPNPSSGTFYFRGLQSGNTIEVHNVLGAIVYIGQTNSDNYPVNLSGQVKGMYFYRASNNAGTIQQGKIILE